jgi:hypothetical protein
VEGKMKRVMSFITALFIVSGFLMPAFVVAGVAGQYKDQSYEELSGSGSTVVSQNGRVQTFKPTANKITSVDVYLKNMLSGKRLNITIKNESDGSVVAPAKASVTFTGQIQEAWITVAYDAPYVTVTPETEYGIYATITGDNQTQWAFHNTNPYTRGKAKDIGGDFDYLFQVWGTKDAATTVVTPAIAESLVIDDSIKPPVLVSAEKQGKDLEVKEGKDVVLAAKDKLVLKGTSFTGAGVAITIDDKEYTASVAPDGSWDYTINTHILKEGTYTIKGQAYKDGKGSEKVDLLAVKVLAAKAATKAASDRSWFAGWNIFFTLIIVGLLLLVLLLLSLIARRHHMDKTGGTKNDKKAEKEDEVIAETEEVVESPKIVKGKKSKNK